MKDAGVPCLERGGYRIDNLVAFAGGDALFQASQELSLKKALEPEEKYRDLLNILGKGSILSIPTKVCRTERPVAQAGLKTD